MAVGLLQVKTDAIRRQAETQGIHIATWKEMRDLLLTQYKHPSSETRNGRPHKEAFPDYFFFSPGLYRGQHEWNPILTSLANLVAPAFEKSRTTLFFTDHGNRLLYRNPVEVSLHDDPRKGQSVPIPKDNQLAGIVHLVPPRREASIQLIQLANLLIRTPPLDTTVALTGLVSPVSTTLLVGTAETPILASFEDAMVKLQHIVGKDQTDVNLSDPALLNYLQLRVYQTRRPETILYPDVSLHPITTALVQDFYETYPYPHLLDGFRAGTLARRTDLAKKREYAAQAIYFEQLAADPHYHNRLAQAWLDLEGTLGEAMKQNGEPGLEPELHDTLIQWLSRPHIYSQQSDMFIGELCAVIAQRYEVKTQDLQEMRRISRDAFFDDPFFRQHLRYYEFPVG